jgi:hypothetical protein
LENSLDICENATDVSNLQDTTEIDLSENIESSFKSPSSNKVTKKRKTDHDKVEKIENRMDEAFNFLKQISQTPSKTKCSLFTDLLCVKLEALSEQKQDLAMMEIDNIMFRLKHSADQMVQPVQPPSYYQFPSTNFPIYSQNLISDNYSTASSSSSSLQPQPSPEYMSSMPSTYFNLSQNQSSSSYPVSMPSPYSHQFQNPSPTPSQYSNIGEKMSD